MKIKKTKGEIAFDWINTIILTLLMIVCLYPLLYVLFASFSDAALMSRHRGILLHPLGFSVRAYEAVFKNPNIFLGYKNTLFYVIVGTLLDVVLTTLGAFVLSRNQFQARKIFMKLFTFTMMFSGGMIPLYLLVVNLGLLDTRWAVILPTAVSTYNLTIMRTSFLEIPVSLEESAKIDGANDLVVLLKIILPLSKATIAVISLFYAATRWNEWFNAAIFLQSRKYYPLQLVLREILIQNDVSNMTGADAIDSMLLSTTIKYATIVVATVPILCVYPFIQKYFVTGVMLGAVKG